MAKVGGCALVVGNYSIFLPDVSSKLLRRLLLLPLVLFLGLELVLWVFVRLPVEPPRRLELRNELPGFKGEVRVVFDGRLARYLDDAVGPKPAGVMRVLCLGGSATFGLFQNAEDTWWGRLGRALQAKGYAVQVAAWGQDRTGVVASIPMAARLLEDWQPDVVIGNFGFDDVMGQPLEYQYVPEKAQGLAAPPRDAGWKRAVFGVSQTARLRRWWMQREETAQLQNRMGRPDYWKEFFGKLKAQVGGMAVQTPPGRDAMHDPEREYVDGWKVLQELCARQGAALIMSGEASLHGGALGMSEADSLTGLLPVKSQGGEGARYVRPDPAWVEGEMKRYAAGAAALAEGARLPWIDLNGRVPRDLGHFFSDVILTDEGAGVVAGELLPVVEPVLQGRRH